MYVKKITESWVGREVRVDLEGIGRQVGKSPKIHSIQFSKN